jgi:hypothetical protein
VDLKETWTKIESYLRECLGHVKNTEQAVEYLDHNELGLAAEVLMEEAESQEVTSADFWRPLAKALILMSESSYYHRT